ncbi:MAG: hypothetical protein ABIO39_07835 [Caulobacteraceae bacterium]
MPATTWAAAADGALTNAVVFQPLFDADRLEGCSISFEAYQRVGGELVQLTGALAVYQQPLAVMVKLGLGRLSKDGARQIIWTAPAAAGLRDGVATTAASLVRAGQSEDTPGAGLFVYAFDPTTVALLRASLNSDRIAGYYVQTEGAPPVSFDVDLGVLKKPPPGAPNQGQDGVAAMKQCVQSLVSPTP